MLFFVKKSVGPPYGLHTPKTFFKKAQTKNLKPAV